MVTERSDVVYGYWREAAEKFDYFVVGLTGALVAYLGQNLKPVRIGVNPESFELLALACLLLSVVIGFKRLETNIVLFKALHMRLYAEESRGSVTEVGLKGMGINRSTGDVYTQRQLLEMATMHEGRANALRQMLDDLIAESGQYYKWRNRLLLNGFVILVFARLLPAYM